MDVLAQLHISAHVFMVLKGVFSKPSGNHIVALNLCFLSYRLKIVATCSFIISINHAKFQQVKLIDSKGIDVA